MELRQLEIFCAVAEKRGFSLAAAALGLTQPTVSFQIAALEEELGTRLFERGGRTTLLTKSGEVLYRYARDILTLSGEAAQAIHSLKGLLWGEVTLGASTIPGEYILPKVLQAFREAHPGIALTLEIDDTAGIVRRVLNNEVDLGVVGAGEKNEKLVFTRFVRDRLVVSASHREGSGSGKFSLEEIPKMPFVMREIGSGTRTVMERKLREKGIEHLNVVMTLGSTEAVKRAVESGTGISIVSERAVRNEVQLGLLRRMEIEGVELERDFFIVHRKQKVLSPAAGALLEFLKDFTERA